MEVAGVFESINSRLWVFHFDFSTMVKVYKCCPIIRDSCHGAQTLETELLIEDVNILRVIKVKVMSKA